MPRKTYPEKGQNPYPVQGSRGKAGEPGNGGRCSRRDIHMKEKESLENAPTNVKMRPNKPRKAAGEDGGTCRQDKTRKNISR